MLVMPPSHCYQWGGEEKSGHNAVASTLGVEALSAVVDGEDGLIHSSIPCSRAWSRLLTAPSAPISTGMPAR
jgi:hypothetical protein